MSKLNKNIEGIDIPPDVLHIIEKTNSDGTISSVKEVLKHESLSLIERTNETFKELCRTLDNEQTRLTRLEATRKRLQEEMVRLKEEIEQEKQNCRVDLEATNSNAEDIEQLNDLDVSNSERFDEMDVDEQLEFVFQRDSEPSTSFGRSLE